MLVLLDDDKNWIIFEVESGSVIHSESDGIRLLASDRHEFISISAIQTTSVRSPTEPGALLIDAYKYLIDNDERGEEIISVLRDNHNTNPLLPDAVAQCIAAATFEFDVNKQKARVGKFLFIHQVDNSATRILLKLEDISNELPASCSSIFNNLK